MAFFNRNKEKIIVTSVAIILIVIIGITSSERLSINSFEKTIGNILSPIGKITTSLSNGVSNFFDNLMNISKLKDENEDLKNQISLLQEENRGYLEIISKTDYLKKEHELLNKTSYNLIAAQITGKEPGNWFDRFTIDKGLKDGIKKGDTVVYGVSMDQNTIVEGIIGRIVDVGDNWSKVVSVIDENSSISFKILRTQDGGIISGSINGQITGYLFDNDADIIKGDKLFTSGLGGGFVKDIYIGEIEAIVSEEEDLMKEIKVKPIIDYKKLHKVFIISEQVEG